MKLGNLVVTTAPAPHSPTSRGAPAIEGPVETPSKISRFFGGSATKKRNRLVMISSAARLILAPAGGDKKEAKMAIELKEADVTCKSQQDGKGYTVWSVLTVGSQLSFHDLCQSLYALLIALIASATFNL